jgi:hypothetical protein
MFELIKAVIEPVIKAVSVPDILVRRDRVKLREIGAELYVFYTSVNEIVVLGDHIVGEIESGVRWMSRKVAEGKHEDHLLTHLPFWLGQQRVSILKASQTIKRLGLELQVIDRLSYAALVPLLHGKGSIVSGLIESCAEENAVLQTYEEQVLLREMDKCRDLAEQRSEVELRHLYRMEPQERQIEIGQKAQRTVLAGLDYIPAKRVGEFESYLQNEKPREYLAAISTALEGLRVQLEKHFTISDILLCVGDRRACPTDRWNGL